MAARTRIGKKAIANLLLTIDYVAERFVAQESRIDFPILQRGGDVGTVCDLLVIPVQTAIQRRLSWFHAGAGMTRRWFPAGGGMSPIF